MRSVKINKKYMKMVVLRVFMYAWLMDLISKIAGRTAKKNMEKLSLDDKEKI
jgi:hypothetical protein